MKKTFALATLVVALLGSMVTQPAAVVARPVSQSGVTAEELLNDLASRLVRIARRYENRGEAREARIWLQWASRYKAQAPYMSNVSARRFLRHNIAYCRTAARQAESAGLSQLAELYRDSRELWKEIDDQLGDDVSDLEVSFPQSMLRVIPGAPGTPWESAGIRQGSAPQLCNRTEYQKCVNDASQMSGAMAIMHRNTCRGWIAGCD